jgi:hypothetical protein
MIIIQCDNDLCEAGNEWSEHINYRFSNDYIDYDDFLNNVSNEEEYRIIWEDTND